jgi:antitoxin Xre/MbcA/ParS-like protein
LALPQLAYPKSRYEPAPLIDLGSRQERERLSPSALKAFFNIVERWAIKDEEARALLGGLSNGPYYKWKKDHDRTLDTDVLMRVSFVIGIFKGLHIVYGKKLADEWVRLPNQNRIFGGQTPLAYMIAGGLPALQTVRRLLDARRGGI